VRDNAVQMLPAVTVDLDMYSKPSYPIRSDSSGAYQKQRIVPGSRIADQSRGLWRRIESLLLYFPRLLAKPDPIVPRRSGNNLLTEAQSK
jgi:hypothetical protein